ncbi:hypothetical protein M0R45_008430 [Rubus argutus]|uniref:Uncharacterized protein n=1 Tax=Rubus argutus TaxID=59490 RepID=A0AAW1Y4W9_RUBAR
MVQENIMGSTHQPCSGVNTLSDTHALQMSGTAREVSEWNFSNCCTLTEKGPFVGFSGTCLDFQNLSEAHPNQLGPDTTRIAFVSTIPPVAVHANLKKFLKSSKGGRHSLSPKLPKTHLPSPHLLETKPPLVSNKFAPMLVALDPLSKMGKDPAVAGTGSTFLREQLQTEFSPSTSRSPESHNEDSINPSVSSGQTPNCPSVMGPVLTHHAQ